jgi:hypothetical protein
MLGVFQNSLIDKLKALELPDAPDFRLLGGESSFGTRNHAEEVLMLAILGTKNLTIPVSLAGLLGALAIGSAQASPTDAGGSTITDIGAEACRAYYQVDAPNIVNTLWGIQNVGGSPAWVTCPVVTQQGHSFALDGVNDRAVQVVGYTEDPDHIVCMARVQNFTGSAVEAKTETLVNYSGSPFDYSLRLVPADIDSWTINAEAFKTVLWCQLPPGAFLYSYAAQEQDD